MDDIHTQYIHQKFLLNVHVWASVKHEYTHKYVCTRTQGWKHMIYLDVYIYT